jgi:FO synthase
MYAYACTYTHNRDRCHYCTFAKHDGAGGERVYMTKEEVLEVARKGASAGCTGMHVHI